MARIINAATGSASYSAKTNKLIDSLAIEISHATSLDLSAAKLTFTRLTGTTQQDVVRIKELLLTELFEISAQMGDGYTEKTKTAGSLTSIKGDVILSKFGIEIGANEDWCVEITGLQTTATITVYALENIAAAKAHLMYQKLEIVNRDKDFEITDTEILAFSKTGLTSIELFHKNGRSIKLLPSELESRARQHNSVTNYLTDTDTVAEAATDKLYVLDVTDFIRLNVITSADTYAIALESQE
jgi:hypothetical protein